MAQQLEFFLLESTDYDEFSKAVNQRLNDGWQLHGNLFAFPNYVTDNKVDTVRYLQAFIKDVTTRARTGFVTGR
jgi:hypothetical protein